MWPPLWGREEGKMEEGLRGFVLCLQSHGRYEGVCSYMHSINIYSKPSVSRGGGSEQNGHFVLWSLLPVLGDR